MDEKLNPAMCACSLERQADSGLHQKMKNQQAEEGDTTWNAVSSSIFPTLEGHGPEGMSTEESR